MEVRIRICQQTQNNRRILSIIDLTRGYLESEDEYQFQAFKKEDLRAIDMITYKSLDGNEVITYNIGETNLEVTKSLDLDGWFEINHIVLPTKQWYDNASEAERGLYEKIFFIDGDTIYKSEADIVSEITIDKVISEESVNTTRFLIHQDVFSIYYLMSCFIKQAEIVLNNNIKCKNSNYSEKIYERDLTWMAINVIQYLVEMNDLEQATIILTKLNQCNGICKQVLNTIYNCGCSK